MILDDLPDLALIRRPVLAEQVIRIGLRGRIRVDLIEQHLNAEQDLLDGDRRLPGFLFVQDRETDSARGVDVRVEERRDEFACAKSACVIPL